MHSEMITASSRCVFERNFEVKDLKDIFILLHIYNNRLVLVWFGLVLWHISHCRLFNVKSIFIFFFSSYV